MSPAFTLVDFTGMDSLLPLFPWLLALVALVFLILSVFFTGESK